MECRKDPLTTGYYYHIFSRSISKYIIFNDKEDYTRFYELISLYRFIDFNYKYSAFKELQLNNQEAIISLLKKQNSVLVEIIAFCVMPTHVHLLLKQNVDNGISIFMSKILNSYTRYFNTRHHRNGPLWESHFKNVLVKNDEQLLHLTRYIHLNPTSARLIKKTEDWIDSSYKEYIKPDNDGICNYKDLFDLTPRQYQKFVNDHHSYQRDLAIIKGLLIDDYFG